MGHARQGRFDLVVVWTFDRMAQSVRHLLETLDELNRLGVEFISVRKSIDTGGPPGRAIVVITKEAASHEGVPPASRKSLKTGRRKRWPEVAINLRVCSSAR